MEIFISWSGDRSRLIAQALREWLPLALQNLEVWMSGKDLKPGMRRSEERDHYLNKAQFGIICITPENLASEWLAYEAGILANGLGKGGVCPVLLNISPDEIEGPLSQFQCVMANESGMLALIRSINDLNHSRKLEEQKVSKLFLHLWPALNESFESVRLTETLTLDKDETRRLLKLASATQMPLVENIYDVEAEVSSLTTTSGIKTLPSTLQVKGQTICLVVVMGGPSIGTHVHLTDRTRNVVFGRAYENEGVVHFDDETMSRKHFRIVVKTVDNDKKKRRAYKFSIEDMGSANGTYVNGKQISSTVTLADRNFIEAGGTKILVLILAEHV